MIRCWRFSGTIPKGIPSLRTASLHLSNGKNGPWLFRVYVWDEVHYPVFIGIISLLESLSINPVFHGIYVRGRFFSWLKWQMILLFVGISGHPAGDEENRKLPHPGAQGGVR